MNPRVHEAYEILVEGRGDAPIVLCCEHASNELHQPWGPDSWLEDTHWAWDPGAAWMTRELAKRWESTAVLARFSRLLIDANRPLYSGTLFRSTAEDRVVHLNQHLTDAERLQRIRRWWTPYHHAMEEVCNLVPGSLLLSIHSFTPVYADQPPREVELGVLFESDDLLANRIRDGLAHATKRDVRPNEPYSGKGGMMYSCYSHARDHGMHAIELEFRQDLLADEIAREQIVDAVATVIPKCLRPNTERGQHLPG